MDGNIETGRLQTPKIEEANDDGKLTIYCQSSHKIHSEPECKLLNLKEEVASDEAANHSSSLNEISSQEN